MERKNFVVLLSGGLDSAITAAYLKTKGHIVKAGIFVNRGQTNYEHELTAAQQVSEYLNIPLIGASFSIPDLKKLLSEEDRKKVGIPARNLILATMALPYAYILKTEHIALGNIHSDFRPDSNREFRLKFSETASFSLGRYIQVIAPLADWEGWDKVDVIRFAIENNYPSLLKFSWTCWENKKFPCGECGACKGRAEGFAEAEIEDPALDGLGE